MLELTRSWESRQAACKRTDLPGLLAEPSEVSGEHSYRDLGDLTLNSPSSPRIQPRLHIFVLSILMASTKLLDPSAKVRVCVSEATVPS